MAISTPTSKSGAKKGYIAPSFIQTLLANVDIVRVIGQHLPLKAKGGDHWACCPFHEETTPSFSVSPDKQFYHCFGCGVHGNAIDFLMEYEHITFPEAIHQLAAWAGMEVVYEARPHLSHNAAKPITKPIVSQEADHADLAACAAYYQAKLGTEHTAYLDARGVNAASIAQFQLGYAPNRDDLADTHLSAARLLELGMLMQRDKDSNPDAGHGESTATPNTAHTFARFQDRLMFPIHTARGKVVGFGARALREGQNPKYLNSAESDIFHKGTLIYGLYQALQIKRRPEYLIVTEGYMDVIAMHQAGFPMAVACMGTAMTEAQLTDLFRRTKRVVLCYDGDTAGRAATEKAVRLALPHLAADEQLNIATLPADTDPDDIIQKEGNTALGAHIDQAQGVIEYILARLADMGDAARADDMPRLTLAAEQWLALTPENAWRTALRKAITDTGIALPETAEPQQHSAGRRGDNRFSQAPHARPDTEIKTPDWATHMLAIALAYPHAITHADKADLALLADARIAILLEIFKHQAAHPDWRADVLLAPWQHDEAQGWLRQAETYARTHITTPERAAQEKAALLAALQAQQARTMFAALSEYIKYSNAHKVPLGEVERALYLAMMQR